MTNNENIDSILMMIEDLLDGAWSIPLSGGKGGVIGSVFGALLLTIISNGLTINSVSSYWQMVISAIILVITIIIYRNED